LTAESSSVSGHRRPDVAIIGENPPPYSTVSRSGVVALDQRADFRSVPFLGHGRNFDSPPLYQSRVDLDASHLSMPEHSTIHSDTSGQALPPAPLPLHAGSVAANRGRLHSVGSFRDVPNMSDVLLTSSRTSLPTSSSAAAAMDVAVTTADAAVAVRDVRPRRSIPPTASSARHETTTSGRSAANDVTTGYSGSAVGRSMSTDEVVVAVTHGRSSDRHRGIGEVSSNHGRRTRSNVVDDTLVSVHPSSISTTSTRRRTTDDTTVETVNQPRPPNRGRQSTRNNNADARLSSMAQSESAAGVVVAADGNSQHRRRNYTNNQRHEQRSAKLISQSLPRMSSVDEEQPETQPTASSSTVSLDLVGYGSVV